MRINPPDANNFENNPKNGKTDYSKKDKISEIITDFLKSSLLSTYISVNDPISGMSDLIANEIMKCNIGDSLPRNVYSVLNNELLKHYRGIDCRNTGSREIFAAAEMITEILISD